MATVGDALALAKRGFRVFPLRADDWRPQIAGWVEKATIDAAQIGKWWTQWPHANVGIATGQGLVVIDIDNKKGKRGSESFVSLDLDLEDYDTFTVSTPSGGRHVYYRTESDVSNSAGDLGSGLDVRGRGGYVVGPGSVLPEGAKDGQAGGEYRVVNDHQIRSAPLALSSRFAEGEGRDHTRANGFDHVRAFDGARAGQWLGGEAKIAVEGVGGDQQTFVVAAYLRDLGATEDEAFDLLALHWNNRCEPPWELEDLRVKVANAYRYSENPIGILSPETQFNGVEVPAIVRPASKFFRHGEPFERSNNWLYYELAPRIGVCVLVGETQAGKTFLEIEMARCGATGKPFFKVEPDEKYGTIFVFAGTEGSDLARRFAALQEDQHLPLSATSVVNLNTPGALKGLLEDLQGEALYLKERFGVRVGCVVLETLAASGLLPKENDAGLASIAMHNLAQIANAMGVLVMTSHHPAKGTNESRGSGAVPAAADYVMLIRRSGRDKVRQVELVKARSAEQRTLGSFSLVPIELGRDDRDRPIRSMSVSMGEAESPEVKVAKHAPLVVECVEWAGIDTGIERDGKRLVPKDEVWKVFKERSHLSGTANQHKAYKQALEFLEGQGVIEFEGSYITRREVFT